jgi:RNA polymerase sigma-70 factor (ECF subfamily)
MLPKGTSPAIPGEITMLLERVQQGDRDAVSELSVLVFPELRRLAVAALRDQPAGHTWMPTDLVNELWVRLLQRERIDFQNRAHFLGSAAHLMRALVIDHARARCAGKRVPPANKVPLGNADDVPLYLSEAEAADLVALDDALCRLALMNERMVQVVELRFFLGFTVEETAEAMSLSEKTVKREWAQARAWLHAELRGIAPSVSSI